MNISEEIHPFSDIKIRDFLRNNKDLVNNYDIKSIADFVKEIISLESDIIGAELVKITDIYKVFIRDQGEDVSFFEYFVDNLNEKSHSVVGKFININLEKNTDFLDYHLNKEIDLIHILLRNNIVPNFRLVKRWSSAKTSEKDFFDIENKPILFKHGASLLTRNEVLDFLIKNKEYFSGDNIIGNEYHQKDMIYRMVDNDAPELFSLRLVLNNDKMESIFHYLKEMSAKVSFLSNEFNIFMHYFEDVVFLKQNPPPGSRRSYFSRISTSIENQSEKEIFVRLRKIWLGLSGSYEKRERDLSYMINGLNYFGQQNSIAIEFLGQIKDEFEAMKDILNKDESDEIVSKTKKRI